MSQICLYKFDNFLINVIANLVRMKIRVEERWLNVLTLHQPQVIFGVEVTALDANQYVYIYYYSFIYFYMIQVYHTIIVGVSYNNSSQQTTRNIKNIKLVLLNIFNSTICVVIVKLVQ